jgi:hypothetical protein
MAEEAVSLSRRVVNAEAAGDVSASQTYEQRDTTATYTANVSIPQPQRVFSGTVSGDGRSGEVSIFRLPALGVAVEYDVTISNGTASDFSTEIVVEEGGSIVHNQGAQDDNSFTGSLNWTGTVNNESLHFYAEGGADENDDWSWDYSVNQLELKVREASTATISKS